MVSELLPMEDLEDLTGKAKDCFVALDLADGRRLVGTIVGKVVSHRSQQLLLTIELPNGAKVREPLAAVQTAFYAPMGYRPPDMARYGRR